MHPFYMVGYLTLFQTALTQKILVPINENNTIGGFLADFLPKENLKIETDEAYQSFDSWTTVKNIEQICLEKLRAGKVDFCLVPKVLQLQEVLKNSDYFLTESWLPVKPVLVTRRAKGDPIGLRSAENYEYFLHPFYSSVWSIVFLASLITIGLLIVFEMTFPFGYKLNSLWGKSTENLGMFECIIVVYTSLFNKSPSRIPRSPSGQMLLMFWYMFCVIILFSYLCGLMVQLISDAYTRGYENEPSLILNNLPPVNQMANKDIIRVDSSMICDKLVSNKQFYSEFLDSDAKFLLNKISSSELAPSFNEAIHAVTERGLFFVTNSILTIDIQTSLKCSTYQPCSVINFYRHPIYWLGFLANNSSKVDEMNTLLLTQQERGQSNGPDFGASSGGNSVLEWLKLFQNITPIRMISMNGPFVFMIIGGFVSIITAFCEYFYRTFVTKEYQLLDSYKNAKEESKRLKERKDDQKQKGESDTITVQTTVV